MRILATAIIGLIFTFAACSQQESTESTSEEPKTLAEYIDQHLENDEYEDAISMLESEEETEEILKLKEKVYLNYGLFLEYRDSEVTNMREKMNNALRQYIKVLKINPDNEKAISEVEQILGIYASFPDRSPDEDVQAELEKLGF